jgi:16S rRNA (guanine(966)-N(2))-methyltransferase RsmD
MPHTRPTTDRAREGLFNILANRVDFEGLRCLDLFAGTGCTGFELSSRGAAPVVAVEKDPAMHAFIGRTALALGLAAHEAVKADAFRYLANGPEPFDLIVADPPYALAGIGRLPDIILGTGRLNPDGYLVIEHDAPDRFLTHPHLTLQRAYGDTVFSFFRHPAPGGDEA